MPCNNLNGGPHDPLTSAASTSVHTGDQEETYLLWSAWYGRGVSKQRRGSLVGRFGLSRQIIPKSMGRILLAGGKAAAVRVHDAIMTTIRTRILILESAFHGKRGRAHVELC